jgi:Ubiquitin-2 like Rad60 SUMO-like
MVSTRSGKTQGNLPAKKASSGKSNNHVLTAPERECKADEPAFMDKENGSCLNEPSLKLTVATNDNGRKEAKSPRAARKSPTGKATTRKSPVRKVPDPSPKQPSSDLAPKSQKPALQKCDSFNLSDGDESDDEDDIGKRLNAVKDRRQQKRHLRDLPFSSEDESENSADDDSNDDDSDTVSVLEPKQLVSGQKRTRFAQRLAEKRKLAKFHRAAKKTATGYGKHCEADDNDSDSGSEVEVLAIDLYTSQSHRKARESLDNFSSDEEKPKPKKAPKKATAFSKAMVTLQTAQAENVEDGDEQEDQVENENNREADVVIVADATTQNENDAKDSLGNAINVTVRTREGGSVREDIFKVRMNEPMSVLLEKYKAKHKLAQSKMVELHFDGIRVNPTATPAVSDMEDDDQIDAVITN